ncbi:MAG: hypothetical protein RhofKO_17320 [Rhodothermales bacterium]
MPTKAYLVEAETIDEQLKAIRSDIQTIASVMKIDRRTATAHIADPVEHISNQQAAGLLGVSKSTLQRWRQQGLPFSQVGQIIFYRRSALDAFIEQHKPDRTGDLLLP